MKSGGRSPPLSGNCHTRTQGGGGCKSYLSNASLLASLSSLHKGTVGRHSGGGVSFPLVQEQWGDSGNGREDGGQEGRGGQDTCRVVPMPTRPGTLALYGDGHWAAGRGRLRVAAASPAALTSRGKARGGVVLRAERGRGLITGGPLSRRAGGSRGGVAVRCSPARDGVVLPRRGGVPVVLRTGAEGSRTRACCWFADGARPLNLVAAMLVEGWGGGASVCLSESGCGALMLACGWKGQAWGHGRASFEQGGGGGEGVLDPKLGVPKMA